MPEVTRIIWAYVVYQLEGFEEVELQEKVLNSRLGEKWIAKEQKRIVEEFGEDNLLFFNWGIRYERIAQK